MLIGFFLSIIMAFIGVPLLVNIITIIVGGNVGVH
ncbi:putative periplasmic phosphate-binding protein [Salmonella enterica subsp. enterica]|uniref:Putative periplasmic phosphate-binding protein n=1 Tax=Salmonella enterica I TaxID=59201 RepID=A0A3S5DMC6_SALET|nr:putative periplasmic phosphate-binding protein [Salmonella enterica subsp. enterica]